MADDVGFAACGFHGLQRFEGGGVGFESGSHVGPIDVDMAGHVYERQPTTKTVTHHREICIFTDASGQSHISSKRSASFPALSSMEKAASLAATKFAML